MSEFRRLASLMLKQPATLAWSLVFAFVSALGLGAGLLSIPPLLKIILSGDKNLALELEEKGYSWIEKKAMAG